MSRTVRRSVLLSTVVGVALLTLVLTGSARTAAKAHEAARQLTSTTSSSPRPGPGDTAPNNGHDDAQPRTAGRVGIAAVILLGGYLLLRRNTGIRSRRRRRGLPHDPEPPLGSDTSRRE